MLAWSQMHGDEPTATAAILDLLHVVQHTPQLMSEWSDTFTLHLIPMLNPDGAARCSRFNAAGIDLNRDAKALQAPESRLLAQMAKQLDPELCLNLHDQSRYYGAGDTGLPCTLSFLAPPADPESSLTPSIQKAMAIISMLVEVLGEELGHAIGRYDEPYTPESFGDTLSAMGLSTVLIESGFAFRDPNRQVAREANFSALCLVMAWLTHPWNEKNSPDRYLALPVNRENGFVDLIIRNVSLQFPQAAPMTVDIAISREHAGALVRRIGDVRAYNPFNEYDAQGRVLKALTLIDGKPTKSEALTLLRKGMICAAKDTGNLKHQLLCTALTAKRGTELEMLPECPPYFLLCHPHLEDLACIDGTLYSLDSGQEINCPIAHK